MAPISLLTNISSLTAQTNLGKNTKDLSKTFERLSSGLRINSASDDPAGLALSKSLESDARVYKQGVRNVNDGISLLNIADSALSELTNVATRIKELSEQASNGTYTGAQREALDEEAQALRDEYFRIVRSTTFNEKELFSSTFGSLSLQAGFSNFSQNLGGVKADGTFAAAYSLASGNATSGKVAVGDLDGDGLQDIASQNFTEAATYIRLSSGNFSTAISYSGASGGVALEDVDSDGSLDLVTLSATYVNVRLNDGSGGFGAVVSTAVSSSAPASLVLGDFNEDGYSDFTTAVGGGPIIYFGDGTGSFASPISYVDSGSTALLDVNISDFNNDGHLDLVTGNIVGGDYGYANVRFGTGAGTLGSATSYIMSAAFGSVSDIEAADLNGDGLADLIAGTASGNIHVRLQQSDGTFGAVVSYTKNAGTISGITIADLNGDGYNDISSSLIVNGTTGAVEVYINNGNGTFASVVSYSSGTAESAQEIAVGDLNGDGVNDIIAFNEGAAAATTIHYGSSSIGMGPILPFSLTTQAGAMQAYGIVNNKLTQLEVQRGVVGSFLSRAEVATRNLESAAENYTLAASRITDVDVAEETSKMIRLQVLQKAGVATLAQANQQPAVVAKLLAKV